ncbi:sugar transferase [Planctomicrobium sp. SH664]|uniref:sugar transferase n=1 Tax=Planctomicrobium sp. SH664 TaxID=3448125 RepID=UPI003F5B8FC8
MDFVKRTFDILLALIGIVLCGPVMIAAALLIRMTSPGPVIYRGVRTGRHGIPFHIYKFRSMLVNAEQLGGTTTGRNDPRITPVGAFLRKYKLDELPQLFNVLFGDMSFIGPRPEVAEYTDAYSREERAILSVRPGITDLACLEFSDLQSHVGTDNPDEVFRRQILPRKNALRLKYVREQSLWLDLRILCKTVFLVASKPFKRAPAHHHGTRQAA